MSVQPKERLHSVDVLQGYLVRGRLHKYDIAVSVAIGVFCLATLAFGQSPQGEIPPAAGGGPSDETGLRGSDSVAGQSVPAEYVIGPEDVLDVEVFNVPELTKTVRVANDGTISLALLGRVRAAGLTADQLRRDLEQRWGQTYLQSPQVIVFIREFHAQPVSVIGAVEKPGVYELKGPRSLIEVLSMAGGLARTGTAAGRTLIVTRRGGFGPELQLAEGMSVLGVDRIEINLQKLLYAREEALNIEVRPYDTISVSRADVVYVVGDVRKPGGFVLADRENLTVLQALALAEGTTGTAAKRQARIIRRDAAGSRTEIPVDLVKILNGKSQDVELAANDILFVPSSTGKAAAKRGAEAVLGTISGILIYRR